MEFMRLTLAGPLQSWGERSKWDHRDTALTPTKSGIIGMIGCCLGIPRGSDELRELDQKLHLAVRVDEPGRIFTDFQTVRAQNGTLFQAASGKDRVKETALTILTPKQYLQDARFTVFLWGDHDLLHKACDAFYHPVYLPYLGRRCCVESVPLCPVMIEANSPDEAVLIGAEHDCKIEIEMLPDDVLQPDERMAYRNDGTINTQTKEFYRRCVRIRDHIRKEEINVSDKNESKL